MSFIQTSKTSKNRLTATHTSLKGLLDLIGNRQRRNKRSGQSPGPTALESLEQRMLLTTTAIASGDWFDASTWDNGVPDDSQRAIIGHGVAVELDGTDHVAQELVVHGDLVVPEENGDPTEVADGRLKLYVNGSLAGDAQGSQLWDHSDMTGIGGITGQTRTHQGIRRTGNQSGDFFDGAIDKVATHNRALSSAEIGTLFASDRQQNEGVPQDGIASLWLFDEAGQDGSDVAVGDGTEDNGTLNGDAATDGALQLDGSGDYVKVGRSTDLNRGVFTEKTVSLWFKADDTDGVQMIYEQGGGTRGLNIYLDGDTLYAGGWNLPNRESGWKGDWITQTGIVAGEWNHVALTLDGNSGSDVDKTLTTRWIHVNSGGEFIVGSENDRYDEGTFTLNLTGTDVYSDHVIETNMMGMNPGTMNVMNNDGFLMTAMGGRVQFYGQDKLSFTKLSATAEIGATFIHVQNTIERNFNTGTMNGDDFVTSAADDGVVNWEVGDQIAIASSSYDYTEEDVRTITAIVDNGNGTSSLTLNTALDYRHYGVIETYGGTAAEGTTAAAETRELDLRAEVALLSRNVKVQGLSSQDTDAEFGDRANAVYETRVRAGGLSDAEAANAPAQQVANGVGGHIMIMPNSGQIVVDGVQLDGLGQSSQKGRYPIHWHLGDDRSGDVLKNSSVTNSNNRGVTIHGTSNLQIEGVVLHDVHGHGFFFEDAVETGNQLIGNLALGIHTVGGNDSNFANPGGKDSFVVDTHDSVLETGSRFSSSAAFWITNPTNTFVGNIAAGAGDRRTEDFAQSENGVSAGTGFWFAIPRTALGSSGLKEQYQDVQPIFAEFGQFDYNTSHTTAVGLNFDRGSDIEDANFNFDTTDFNAIQGTNEYSPRTGSVKSGLSTTNVVKGFTNYKATDAAFYHRGDGETIQLDGLKVADSYNGPWAVSENIYDNSLFVGHSDGNADWDAEVGGPRLYDGAGLYTNTHFAGFADADASAFQVEGSSFGPTMYHAFRGTSFEADGTYDHIAHAVSDFTENPDGHNLGQPSQWIKGVIDLDGTLTSGVGGGAGSSIVPNVDFLVDGDDFQPDGWDAWVTDDLYTRVRITGTSAGDPLFPSNDTGEPLVRFTARDGDTIDVMSGQNNGNQSWTQIAAKTESDGFVNGTLTVEFMRNGVPDTDFVIHTRNQDGDRPDLNPDIQAKTDSARVVVKIVAAGNYIPSSFRGITEVATEAELRAATEGLAYFSDDLGNLYLNTDISSGWSPIELTPGDALQTAFVPQTIDYDSTIQAENFDNGIDGIAYHDTDSTNSVGTFRSDTGVDTSSTVVSDIADGEWLEYTANIVGGAYNIGVNVSSTVAGGEIRVLAASSNSAGFLRELGTVEVPNTSGDFSTLWLEGIDLAFAEGPESVLRLEFMDGGFEVDSVKFTSPTQTAYVDRTITADLTTTQIKLRDFDTGGQGVAYFDTSPGNDASTEFRVDEDVETNGDILTNQVFEGEWLEYTTDIQAGLYNITLGKSWGGPDTGVKLYIGDSNSTNEFTELGVLVGDGDSLELADIDLSPWAGGDRVIRIEIVGNWMGLNYLNFANTGSTQSAYVDRTITATATTRIELEEYDNGGEGVAYFDTSADNGAGDFRAGESVDTNGDILTNDVFEGEWLEYTTDIEAGLYDITLRKAWSAGDAGVKLLIADSNSATEFTELGVFSFGVDDGELFTLSDIDLTPWAGIDRLIRIEILGNWMGLDYLDFGPAV